MDFGDNFKKARKLMGYSQKQVADKLNIYQSNVSDWENNVSRLEYENLIALAELYETTVDDLLGVQKKF